MNSAQARANGRPVVTDDPGPRLGLLRAADSALDAHMVQVDAVLVDVLAELADLWSQLPDNHGRLEILGAHDLPGFLTSLVDGGGKRLRPMLCYLGWLAAGGRDRGDGHREVVTVGAALELLHVFALVHDDVMDESASRRGRATVHIQARELHESAFGTGNAARFGESIAILVGDLAHAEAGHLVAALPRPMRQIWRLLVAELVAGQRRDLVGSAAGRRDLQFARSVARMKSGRYTVERPLELGAAAAGADDGVTASLAAYGRSVGEAFALRDDLLGIWGDPARTGKPAGDDLISGKPTVILALAQDQLVDPAGRAALQRVGSPDFSQGDLTILMRALEEEGVATMVEQLIVEHVDAALQALQNPELDPAGVAELTRVAHHIAWRDR